MRMTCFASVRAHDLVAAAVVEKKLFLAAVLADRLYKRAYALPARGGYVILNITEIRAAARPVSRCSGCKAVIHDHLSGQLRVYVSRIRQPA